MNSASSSIDYEEGRCISTEMANEMSLFYAEATPMLKTLSDASTRFVQEVYLSQLISYPHFSTHLHILLLSGFSDSDDL